MNRSIEVLKAIYKPYRYTIKGKATLLETTTGEYIVKEKTKDLTELYTYLLSRNFNNIPRLIDSSRKDINVFECIKDINIPKEQKCLDLIDIVASLHNKTSYFKEVSIDTYQEIYENILSNLNYLKNRYNLLYEIAFREVYMSPFNYNLARNYYKIKEVLDSTSTMLDDWFELVKEESKIRVSNVHNDLKLEHFLDDKIISWDKYSIDTPIKDIVNLYKNIYLDIDFRVLLDRYKEVFPILPYEEKLLYILVLIPEDIDTNTTEFRKCENLSRILDYLFKTSKVFEKEEEQDL